MARAQKRKKRVGGRNGDTRRSYQKPENTEVVQARVLAQKGWKWDEIEKEIPEMVYFKRRKERFNMLTRKTFKSASLVVTKKQADECLKVRREVGNTTVLLSIEQVIDIRLAVARGVSYRDARAKYCPGQTIDVVKKVVYGELFEYWPGPVKTRRALSTPGLTEKERKEGEKAMRRLERASLSANVESLTSDEKLLVDRLRKMAAQMQGE